LRLWDNIFAYGTRFILSASLAILKLLETNLLGLDLGGINEYFKKLKDEDAETISLRLLPDFESIIQESKKINITDEKIEAIMDHLDLSAFKEQKSRPDPIVEDDVTV
jgi:hypothetical protein